MKRYRRPAYTLIYLIAAFPLIAAVSTSAYLLADRAIQLQGREQRRVNIDVVTRDFVRRLQADARLARSVRITDASSPKSEPQSAAGFSPSDPSSGTTAHTQPTDATNPMHHRQELTLDHPGQQVAYRAAEGRITRTCSPAGAAPTTFEWTLQKGGVEFRLETINGSPAIIWIIFTREIPTEAGTSLTRLLSAAAPISQGGTQ